MRIPLRVASLVLFMMAVSVVSIHAQVADNGASVNSNGSENVLSQTASGSPYRLKKGDNELGFWGGAAFQATTIFGGLKEDEARGRKLVLAAFRYGRTLFATKNTALQYTLDAVPLAVAVGNLVGNVQPAANGSFATTARRESTYGAGVTPLGLQVDFRNSHHIKPFLHVNGGLLIFTKPVPLPDSGKFAYVGEAGTGLRIFTSDRRAVTLGVRFHHISNGNRSGSNRGLNEFVVYAGFSIFK